MHHGAWIFGMLKLRDDDLNAWGRESKRRLGICINYEIVKKNYLFLRMTDGYRGVCASVRV